ncbi:hypothetical protein [Nannocystis pusilla]|uniref:hypothetical protein n=1 Tax=Nannocystis pusilla TaxID=889268 RepID=UPI003B823428
MLGFGYDLFLDGRTPHPFVLWGIGMLCLPFLSISRNNYRIYQEEREAQELPRPSRQVLREIAASMQRHTPELVEQAVVVAMAQLDRLKDERYTHDGPSFRSTTIRQLGRGAQKEDHDVDSR